MHAFSNKTLMIDFKSYQDELKEAKEDGKDTGFFMAMDSIKQFLQGSMSFEDYTEKKWCGNAPKWWKHYRAFLIELQSKDREVDNG